MIHQNNAQILDKQIWTRLFEYLRPRLEGHASRFHSEGVLQLRLESGTLPTYSQFAERVRSETGWTMSEAKGELQTLDFFQELAAKRFPVVKTMRPIEQLYGGIDPDFWHEAFGHIPVLTHPGVSDLYFWMGKAGVDAARSKSALLDKLSKLYWSIAEYGFVSENRKPKLFGAALIGSPLAVERYLAGNLRPVPFSIQKILSSNYDPHRYQPFYFEMESIEKTLTELKLWYSSGAAG